MIDHKNSIQGIKTRIRSEEFACFRSEVYLKLIVPANEKSNL